jgi:hypothetical protein
VTRNAQLRAWARRARDAGDSSLSDQAVLVENNPSQKISQKIFFRANTGMQGHSSHQNGTNLIFDVVPGLNVCHS